MIIKDTIPTLSHATERDIDLFLVEELICSPETVEWFLEQASIKLPYSRHEVLHSKRRTRNRREIDIFVEGHSSSGEPSWALLIENKLDAVEQPDQAESYREELDHHYDGHKASKAILIAPQAYGDIHAEFRSKFDVFVSYEDFAQFLKERTKSDNVDVARDRFKVDCFQQAITKQRRGYTKIANPKIRDFNQDYVSLMRNIAPQLKPGKTMLSPANPDESVSMILDNSTLSELPSHIRPRRFAIELGKNNISRANYVAITLGGWGHAVDDIRENYVRMSSNSFPSLITMKFHAKPPTKTRPNPGLVISIPTCPVDNQSSVSEQRDLITDGFLKAVFFKSWLIENQNTLQTWFNIVKSRLEGQTS